MFCFSAWRLIAWWTEHKTPVPLIFEGSVFRNRWRRSGQQEPTDPSWSEIMVTVTTAQVPQQQQVRPRLANCTSFELRGAALCSSPTPNSLKVMNWTDNSVSLAENKLYSVTVMYKFPQYTNCKLCKQRNCKVCDADIALNSNDSNISVIEMSID